jgi:hypothetical protein
MFSLFVLVRDPQVQGPFVDQVAFGFVQHLGAYLGSVVAIGRRDVSTPASIHLSDEADFENLGVFFLLSKNI